jgi:antibiotic biosynthesis monooxygenase (ABM) superfamily enzyme
MATDKKPTVITLTLEPRPELHKSFVDWQGRFNASIISFPGFISLEFLAPWKTTSKWTVIQRFGGTDVAEKWLRSPIRRDLIQELKTLVKGNRLEEIAGEEPPMNNGVTELFVANVDPEHESAFRNWTARIHQLEANFPGFRGVLVQSPPEGHRGHWLTLLQFDTIANLDHWLNSPERLEMLKESESFISTLQANRFISAYSGWFSSIATDGSIPAVWKQNMLVLLVLFPIVMLELRYLSPLLSGMNFSLAMFISNAISVTLIAFPGVPLVSHFFKWWLLPRGHYLQLKNILGALLVAVLYALLVAAFWS